MHKTIYSTRQKLKTTTLNKANWDTLAYNKDTCFYQHKKRKKIILHYDMKKKTGIFYDEEKKKPISEVKIIKWR